MDKPSSIIISSLIALTAIVALATKIVELRSALIKYKTETKTQPEFRTTWKMMIRYWMPFIAFAVMGIYLVAYTWLPDKPLTRQDAARIVICGSLFVFLGRKMP